MAFFKKMYQKLLGEEVDEENELQRETVEDNDREVLGEDMADEKNTRDLTQSSSRSLELKIAKLSAFDGSVMDIADHLIAGRPVVLNLEACPRDAIKRIIDFFSGVAYTVRGQLKNITGSIYIVTPNNVDVSGEIGLLSSAAKPLPNDTSTPSARIPDSGKSASPYEGF